MPDALAPDDLKPVDEFHTGGPETSFLAAPSVHRDAAPVAERPRGDFALDYFGRVFAATEKAGGPPPLGSHLMMRGTAGEKLSNCVATVEAGPIAPVEMIFRKPG